MKEIFLFEIKYRLRRPVTYIYIFLMFIIPCLLALFSLDSGTAQFVNSPSSIASVLGALSMLGLFFYAAIMGVPVFRDEEHKTAQTYFTFPVTEKNYILGRFLGSFTIVTIMNIGAVLGTMIGIGIGALWNRPDYGVYTAFDITSYILPFVFFLTLNSLFIGALFFSLMTFFKRMSILYLGGILIFILSNVAGTLLSNLDSQWLSIYVDPFGSEAYKYIKKYWSINEVNTLYLPMYGEFLVNRLLWLAISVGIFLFTLFKFSYPSFLIPKKAKKLKEDNSTPQTTIATNSIKQVFSNKAIWGNLWSLSKIEFLSIVKENAFRILILVGIIFSVFIATQTTQTYGTPSLPITRFMVQELSSGLLVFSIIILVIYAGEAVHRTRKSKTFEFYDALPVTNATLYISKIIALIGVAVVLTLITILVGMLYQTYNGYFNYELGMYLTFNFAYIFPAYITTVLLAFFIHILANNKFLGHFLVIVISLGLPLLITLVFKVNNPLFLYGGVPGSFLSDLNGFGHYLTGSFWLNLYWVLFSCILAVVGYVFWSRGFYSSFKERLRLAASRFKGKTIIAFVVFSIGFVAVGAYSYYNLQVLNSIGSADYSNKIAADAEKKYAKYINKPHIQIIDLKAKVDIYPEERDVYAEGNFTAVNNFDTPIDTLLMEVKFGVADTKITKVVYNGKELQPFLKDSIYRLFIYKLPQPLQPKDTASLVINTRAITKGFSNGLETNVLNNGSFFRDDIFPSFHYEIALNDNGTRKKYGLEEMDYLLSPRTDSIALRKNLFNEDANYMNFEATVSTAKGQTAIAPGNLIKKWDKDNRSYFTYKLSEKTDYFFNFASAAYDVKKDNWTAPSGKKVTIEIYHSPKHKKNLEHFINGIKISLDYNSKNFYEYPYSIIRIVEFPAYSTFAQSFATTIPYSEDFGFVANFSEAEDFNYAFRVTSHEVAHQWWGHIVTPSKTSGSNIISETLAEYVSLMTMKKEYGENGIKSFLKNSLDSYLSARQFSFKPERSLLNVETGQHIWYRKGSMVMYELQDVIGEDKINSALKQFLNEYKYFNKGVYATSENLYDAIYAIAPDSLKYKVTDGFKEIVLYENKVVNAKTKKLDNGKWETTFTVNSSKIYYDDKGKERETDTKKNLVDIGLFGPDIKNDENVTIKNPYYFELKWLAPGDNTFTIVTDKKPEKAGIDPYNKLIDRKSGDNLKDVLE
ncbi:M1 family aminopeptidase [Cellulophaga lytica]|uniref:Peptidase M1 membrane alanine aminopeptidase n=1 Tax=Cellulophaga lytica (strain ATCC 23178 / DSM 7489 / JCM 8516 / NBRC 14961 / NCIMB 1423 / VKM B-1433 / Cy l20) TaxID=867900 RepID=F0R9P8_CELLC|nr:M1 family aminopeptidase [Cellulophaga lytica]ADY29380.1 Peptidase M1 membrane alanine aminopeptidase [Cellulophaga lytica DSM 7489]AIM60394.1 peptidase M1 [Cellulophaga lytica]WQG76445.1 M1 family aminopeptidase [Cellulophaga lytica]